MEGLPNPQRNVRKVREGLLNHLVENDPLRGLTIFARGKDVVHIGRIVEVAEDGVGYSWIKENDRQTFLTNAREELELLTLEKGEDYRRGRLGKPRSVRSRPGMVLKRVTGVRF